MRSTRALLAINARHARLTVCCLGFGTATISDGVVYNAAHMPRTDGDMARKRKSETQATPADTEEAKEPMTFVGTHIESSLLIKLDNLTKKEKRKRAAMHRILLEEAINARAQTLSI